MKKQNSGLTSNQKENIIENVSSERLRSYKLAENEDFNLIYNRYLFNVKVSESFYQILSALEISLRNRLFNAVSKLKGNDWLLNEIDNQNILSDNERKLVIDAHKKIINKIFKDLNNKNKLKDLKEQKTHAELWEDSRKSIKIGGIIAELTFGFWVNLCKKSYKNSLWDKKGFFDSVFPDFDKYFECRIDKPKAIFPYLKDTLMLRNRIFHHEIIINNKNGIKNSHDKLYKLLCSLSTEYANSFGPIFRFEDIIKQKP